MLRDIKQILNLLQYEFKDKTLIHTALTHKSIKNTANNERLEFLGDAVLDLVVGEYLFFKFSNLDEGSLSKMRSFLVNEDSCAVLGRYIKLQDFIMLAKYEEQNGGRFKNSIISDAFEAIIGAMYIDGGLNVCKNFIVLLLEANFKNIDLNFISKDYKTNLQEITQLKFGEIPKYILESSSGPDHDKTFTVCVMFDSKKQARASAKTKKQAQQNAAKIAIENLKEQK